MDKTDIVIWLIVIGYFTMIFGLIGRMSPSMKERGNSYTRFDYKLGWNNAIKELKEWIEDYDKELDR